jgi:hypothetical protein
LNVTKYGVNGKSVFKVHGEGFLLEWEIDKNFFLCLFTKFVNEILQDFRLSFLQSLRDFDHVSEERHFLNHFVVLFHLNNIEVLK